MPVKILPLQIMLRQLFNYDPNQGVLVWRSADEIRIVFSAGYAQRNAGQVAGYVKNQKGGRRRYVTIQGIKYLHYRLVYAWHYGPIPDGKLVDHINRQTLDDRIENLRIASRAENSRNNSARGYFWDKHSGKWIVKVKADGKYHYGGLFTHEHKASLAARELKKRLHGKFAAQEPMTFSAIRSWISFHSSPKQRQPEPQTSRQLPIFDS